jgi:hypothetical protein
MGVDVSEQREQRESEPGQPGGKKRSPSEEAPTPTSPVRRALFQLNLREGIRALEWTKVLLYGVAAGIVMALSFLESGLLSIVAGIVPVGTGLLLARRVKGHYALHGFVAGLVGALVGTVVLTIAILFTPIGASMSARAIAQGVAPDQATTLALWLQSVAFLIFSLVTFSAFGASMAGRTEERQREARKSVEERGGRLEKPSVIRSADDIRGLSLPQFGGYVSNLFKKQGFTLQDYRFIDKDKHLDMWFSYQDEPWHLRLSVADKVSPGTVEGLNQELKREGCRKGIVLTSTEFMPTTLKAAKGRSMVLIDGQMLYEIAEK